MRLSSGGKETNKHESKKLRSGKGPAGKTIVAGIKPTAKQIEYQRLRRSQYRPRDLAGVYRQQDGFRKSPSTPTNIPDTEVFRTTPLTGTARKSM